MLNNPDIFKNLVCKNINPSPIKKIINKKVTFIALKVRLPVF